MYKDYIILHIDLDTFFLSVELREKPKLKNYPCAVSGLPHSRSVILSASYNARKYGIRAGMSPEAAIRLCPKIILIPPRIDFYRSISANIMNELANFSPDYTVDSIDEMTIDISRVLSLHGNAIKIARKIKELINKKFSLTCSIGIAPNRFLAKFASDLRKPDSITLLGYSSFIKLTENMSINRLNGIGPKTALILEGMGINTIGKLRSLSIDLLRKRFGLRGEQLYLFARGMESTRKIKEEKISISKEMTLLEDTLNSDTLHAVLMKLSEENAFKLREQKLKAQRLTLKVKYFDFQTITRSTKMRFSTNREDEIYKEAKNLLKKIDIRPVRLLGISLSNFTPDDYDKVQLNLFEDEKKDKILKILKTEDNLKKKFGKDIIHRASQLILKNQDI